MFPEKQKFLERDFLLEKLSREAPIYIVMEGSEPQFFTRFFTWDSAKSSVSTCTNRVFNHGAEDIWLIS